MLVSEYHEACTILSSRDEEGIPEYLAEVSFTLQRIFLRFVPWSLSTCTCKHNGLRGGLVASICEEDRDKFVLDWTASIIFRNKLESEVLSCYFDSLDFIKSFITIYI